MVFNPDAKWSRSQTRELIGFVDVNGVGVPDVVTVTGAFLQDSGGGFSLDPTTLKTKVYYNPEAKTHLLTGIENPSGSKLVIHYNLRGNNGPQNGRPLWAVTAVGRFDGYSNSPEASTPRGQTASVTTYKYLDDGYFNRAEKQFYGFSDRTSTTYGCEAATAAGKNCFELLQSDAELDDGSLRAANFVPLQQVHQKFSNRDFLT